VPELQGLDELLWIDKGLTAHILLLGLKHFTAECHPYSAWRKFRRDENVPDHRADVGRLGGWDGLQ
jgi:hypothetical protein